MNQVEIALYFIIFFICWDYFEKKAHKYLLDRGIPTIKSKAIKNFFNYHAGKPIDFP